MFKNYWLSSLFELLSDILFSGSQSDAAASSVLTATISPTTGLPIPRGVWKRLFLNNTWFWVDLFLGKITDAIILHIELMLIEFAFNYN